MSVSGRGSEADFYPSSTSASTHHHERVNFKWSALYSELEVVDGPAHGTLARLTAGGYVNNSGASTKRSSLGRSSTPALLSGFNR